MVKTILTIFVALLIIAFAFMGMNGLIKFGPKAEKTTPEVFVPTLGVRDISSGPAQVVLKSQGQVQPALNISLSAEVGGRIQSVSPQFVSGGRFLKGETILQIDVADYETRVASAKSAIAENKLALTTEKARAEQAKRDWKKLGRGELADPLVLRVPQIEAAQARLESAVANLEQAERDLERTVLKAPFDCLLVRKNKDLGSFVNRGEMIGNIQSVDRLELRLPLSLEDYGFLKEGQRGEVVVRGKLGQRDVEWQGELIRSEGIVDEQTRSLFVVAKIFPNEEAPKFPPAGMFLNADISGIGLENIYAIPRESFLDRDTVFVVDENQKLQFEDVRVIRRNEDSVLIQRNERQGELTVVVSPISIPVEGMSVQTEYEKDGVESAEIGNNRAIEETQP